VPVVPVAVEVGKEPTPTVPTASTTGDEPATAPAVPASIEDAMHAAAALVQAGDRAAAIAVLHAGVSRWPRHAEARVELARLYLAADDAARAHPHAVAAVEERPDWSTAWNTLGRAELGRALLEDALVSFERAIAANPDNRYAWNNLGHTRILREEWQDAALALAHAVDGDEVEPYMWNNLGMALENLDRLDEARAAYEQGAAAGSTLAARNRERLEGLDTIAASPPVVETGDTD
jgi:tetratricopeptide (TPR) repeat protein